MEFGILVDRPVDLDQQPRILQPRKMLLKIAWRPSVARLLRPGLIGPGFLHPASLRSAAIALQRPPCIVGTDIAHAVPLTLLAGAGHWWMGSVDCLLLVSLLSGSIPGIAIGSHLASRVPDRVLRPLMAGTLALVGGRLVF